MHVLTFQKYQMMIRSQTGQPVEVYLCPERASPVKPPSIGYYASAEFTDQANEAIALKQEETDSASHLGMWLGFGAWIWIWVSDC